MVNEAAISHQLLSHLRHHSLFALRFSLRANQLSTFANVGRSRIGFGVLVDSGSQGNSEKRRAKGEERFAPFLASNVRLRVSNKCVLRRFLKQFVAVVVGSLRNLRSTRFAPSAFPSTSSERPSAYPSALSNRLTPASRQMSIRRRASSTSVVPIASKKPVVPPNVAVP